MKVGNKPRSNEAQWGNVIWGKKKIPLLRIPIFSGATRAQAKEIPFFSKGLISISKGLLMIGMMCRVGRQERASHLSP